MLEALLDNFEKQIAAIIQKEDTHLSKADKGIELCNTTLSILKDHIEKENFDNLPEEIIFFKKVKPSVMSYFILFSEVRYCEIRKPKAGVSFQVKFLQKEIRKVNKFFSRNADFVHYMEQGHTYLDIQFFTRNFRSDFPFNSNVTYYQFSEFATSHDMLWSKVKAMYRFIHYIREEMEQLRPGNKELYKEKKQKSLNWTASKTSLIELIYALYADGAVNHGTADLSAITASFQEFFNVKLDNVYKTYSEIKARKGSKTKFLEELMLNLQQKMSREDSVR